MALLNSRCFAVIIVGLLVSASLPNVLQGEEATTAKVATIAIKGSLPESPGGLDGGE